MPGGLDSKIPISEMEGNSLDARITRTLLRDSRNLVHGFSFLPSKLKGICPTLDDSVVIDSRGGGNSFLWPDHFFDRQEG